MKTLAVVLLSVLLAGCAAEGRIAYHYKHPTKKFWDAQADFVSCQFKTNRERGELFDACLIEKGYTPVYAD